MKFPTIAAVIPNYNYARFLPYALDSVLAQTSPFDEIIVVDDGSIDNSLEVLAQYDGRIKVISIPNGGQLGAVRAGVITTTSDYIYTLDADDFADPRLVGVVKQCLAEKRPVKVQFQLRGVSEEGELFGSTFPTFPLKYDRPEMLHDNKYYGFYTCPPTSGNVFSREALERLGFRSFDPRGVIDGSASLAMPYLGEIMTLNEPLAHYRVHGNSMSRWATPTIELLQREIRIFKETWEEVGAALNFDKPPFFSRPLYIIERHVFQRPNGLFFLEPSFFSFFTASAAIIEITYFKRPTLIALMTMATILSFGGTGLTMLVVAAPLLLARQSPRLVLPLGIVGIVGLVSVWMLGTNLPLLSRMNELDTGGASGSMRLVVPLNRLIELLSDPSYLFTGTGAGSTTSDLGSAWPMLKLAKEYGIITMFAFVLLYASAFFGSYNIPVKIAAAIIFHFTGGYLLDSLVVQFFTLIFCMTEPLRSPMKSLYTGRQVNYV